MNHGHMLRLLATISTLTLAGGQALAQTIFVPEGSANSVLMVDVATGSAINRIEGLEAVHGLSGAPGVPVLVAGSYAEIDRDDAMSTGRPDGVSADEHAAHHASSADKSAERTDSGLSLLSILDVQSGTVLRKVEVPGAVHHTAVSTDGRFAVATHPSADSISVVDLTRYEVVASVPTGSMPNYAVFGSDPGVVYVSNAGNGTVSEVDLERGIVRRNLIAGNTPEHMTIDSGSGVLYVADAEAGQVLELALGSGEVRRSFDIGGEIHGIDVTDNGSRLIVAGLGENKLALIDLADGTVKTVPLAPQPYHLTTVPDAGKILVSSRAEPKVWIVDANDLSVISQFATKGEGHQMVALRP